MGGEQSGKLRMVVLGNHDDRAIGFVPDDHYCLHQAYVAAAYPRDDTILLRGCKFSR
jgi:hypothetical protein